MDLLVTCVVDGNGDSTMELSGSQFLGLQVTALSKRRPRLRGGAKQNSEAARTRLSFILSALSSPGFRRMQPAMATGSDIDLFFTPKNEVFLYHDVYSPLDTESQEIRP